MRYTIIGDPHAKPDNLDKINKLFDIAEDLGNPVIILGDLLDTKEMVRGRCLNTYIHRIDQSELDFIIITGNHDWHNLQCLEHSLESLKYLSNVKVIDKPETIVLGEVPCRFYPFMADIAALKADLDGLTPKPIFGHFDVVGFDYGNGHFSEAGLTLTDFSKFPTVISGHYHKYQVRGNFAYLGTPFSHSFGESNQTKFLGIFDSETLQLELLETPFPQHKTLEVSPEIPTFERTESDIVRVIVSGPKDFVKAYAREPGIKYISRETHEEESNEIIVDETQSPEVQFHNWAKDIRGLDEETIEAGVKLLKCL